MSVDFLNNECKESSRNCARFGICDNQNGDKAYTLITNEEQWVARVINNNRNVSFTPIDNCITIFKADSKDKESTCDGMLTFNDHLYLVELKVRGTGGWLPDAIKQLRNTIKLLEENHEILPKYKKAFACNRKHPRFRTIDNELNKRFFRETNGFRLDAQSEIIIK